MVVGYKQIAEANEAIRTTVIEKKNKKTGEVTKKDYAEVFQKIKAFRMLFPMGSITTEHQFIGDGVVMFKAFVKDDEGNLLGTGTAYEKEGSSFINETSYIENCETSAVGRALSMCGIGIDLGVASYEEVANAMLNQEKPAAKTKKVEKVQAEVVKETPKEKKEKEMIPGYPDKDEMIRVIKKHYPDGSEYQKKLIENARVTNPDIEKVEDMTEAQMAAVYNKFGGR